MKKFICFFTCCISMFVFYFIFDSCSQEEYSRISSPILTVVSSNYEDYIYDMDFHEDIEKGIQELQAYAKAYHVVIYLGSTLEDNMKARFYEDPYGVLDGLFPTKYHQELSFTDEMQGYVSSKEDVNAIDVIDFMDSRNSASYQDTIRLYPLHMFPELAKDMSNNIVHIFTTLDTTAQQQSLTDSGLDQYIIMDDYDTHIETDMSNVQLLIQVLCICGIAMLLLYSCELYRRRKEMMIRKCMGQSIWFITKDMFLKQFILYISCYVVIQVLCFLIWIGSIRIASYPLIVQLLNYFFVYLLIQVLVYVCMYVYIRYRRHFVFIKQQAMTNTITVMHMVVKIIVVCIFLPSFILHILDVGNMVREYAYMIQHEEELKNQLYIEGFSMNLGTSSTDNNWISRDDAIKEINMYLEEHGAIYQDFDEFYGWQEIAEEGEERNAYIIVNQAYISSYELKDVDGNLIDLDSIEETTLLIPEGVALLQEASMYCEEACEVMTIQSGVRYWNHQIDANIRSLKDPLIVLKKEVSANLSGSSGYHLVLTDERVETEFQTFLKEKGYAQMVRYQYTSDDYDSLIEAYKDKLCYVVPLLIVYLCVMMVFIYQIVYVYFEQRKQRLIMQYMIGDSFLQRHGSMLYWNVLSYACIMVGVYVLSDVSIVVLFTMIVVLIVLEYIAQYELIHRIEKHNMVKVLKGE